MNTLNLSIKYQGKIIQVFVMKYFAIFKLELFSHLIRKLIFFEETKIFLLRGPFSWTGTRSAALASPYFHLGVPLWMFHYLEEFNN